jgi:ABC-2 type transport system ATP-binding protein
LPEERGLYKKEKVLDTMVYFGRLKGMTAEAARKWSLEFLERVELSDKAGVRLDKLSGGQQQKVQLGVTIMNRPKLLILDEPTKGFDPVNRRLMMEIIEERRLEGATIILVTHQMEEVERLCDRIVLLKDGRRRLYGAVEAIKRQYGSDQIEVRFGGKLEAKERLFSVVRKAPGLAVLAPKEGVTAQQIMAELADRSGLMVSRFEIKQASLDDIFVQIYREDEADHA